MPEPIFPGIEVHHRGSHFAVLDAGAQALAWTPPAQLPVLWTSPLATFEPGEPQRAGVPVVFPWFGLGPDGDRPSPHGFARTATWERAEVVDDLSTGGALTVRHTLNEAGQESAPFRAELITRFTPSEFRVSLQVTNTDTAPFTYEEALHSYFAVSDIARISIDGLDGCSYLDRVSGAAAVQAGPVTFTGETDRIYAHTGEAVIDDPEWSRKVHVAKEGSADTVIWNPGATKGRAQVDIGQYHADFACIEAANVRANAITLAPGESHVLAQVVSLS